MISVYWLWHLQDGLCFYCGRWCWVEGTHSFAEARRLLGMPPEKAWPLRRTVALMRRMATREHLHRQADGGGSGAGNIVMACHECNNGRGHTPVLLHLSNMRAKYDRPAVAPEPAKG